MASRICCSNSDCSASASLRCPTCIQLEINSEKSYFCSQTCFRSAWKEHKALHVKGNSERSSQTVVRNLKHHKVGQSRFSNFRYTGKLRPGVVSSKLSVPDYIPKPDYWESGIPVSEEQEKDSNEVKILSDEEIRGVREACRVAREVLDEGVRAIGVGVTTDKIDKVIHKACIEHNAYPSPLNYYGFPKSVCTSVNEVICHGIPDDRPLQDGDIVNLDVTVYYNGFHGDLNETHIVGNVDEESKKLIKSAYDSLHAAIACVKPGVLYREFGNVIDRVAQSNGHQVVRTYCGHGIHRLFHTAPNIPHYRKNKAMGVCKPSQVFTIEPMINQGTYRDITWPDGWTAVTADGKCSAQFEHTLLVTENSVEILTARLPTSPKLWWE
ncbi:Methionine aminopeptidase 1 [Galdieria sulphuraria]|uniref:Methionine aminopeptidase n=1 Tax=Galdieria sulphuraria TaxID=130081 RepID=M2WXS1_GALSU|nr:methionyl aminopeptidase [Galdieria sulphuraria]EME28845.1 methionyl aminopeptidase [Galdieria sulphuraria]GJD11201.1 Methionine aminopeptidase 1 [Galdieria sulphuraria]|eukprot:XP_005705365.1 methionyl aminopeptidase [Galdieria sulphuraria]